MRDKMCCCKNLKKKEMKNKKIQDTVRPLIKSFNLYKERKKN